VARELAADRRTDWRVSVTPVTTAYASINVAGPKSAAAHGAAGRGVDLSPEAFPYMRVRQGRIAGVDDCVMWRIGFTGELSTRSTCRRPTACTSGRRCWTPGRPGHRPFGVEAQRMLRLEKGHLIVAQDTDG
jgi:sarcosine oxidase subunit alpha